MTNVWTVVFFAAAIYDFFNGNILVSDNILLALSGIYAASLAIYSAEKEFRRWHQMHDSAHPGEVYAVVWTVLVICLIVGSVFSKNGYHIPVEVSASYIAVISILAITRESKNFYKRKGRK